MSQQQTEQLKRQWRSVAARHITRAASQSISGIDEADLMASISLEDIDTLPHWCALEDEELATWQHTTGALFVAPALFRSLNGEFLRRARDTIGSELFSRLLEETNLPDQAPNMTADDDLEHLLELAGAGVLSSLIRNDTLRELFGTRLLSHDTPCPTLEPDVANDLYLRCAAILTDDARSGETTGETTA
ncbi:MAG: hypothetical protein CSB44_01325 [Gammaproteobacteria bacterium]|nr:MAG: hypothetical protein CSB44_01325 [Gammaproteobacteria bacterium]